MTGIQTSHFSWYQRKLWYRGNKGHIQGAGGGRNVEFSTFNTWKDCTHIPPLTMSKDFVCNRKLMVGFCMAVHPWNLGSWAMEWGHAPLKEEFEPGLSDMKTLSRRKREREKGRQIKILGSYVETTASLQGRHRRRHSRGARRPRPGAPDPPHLAAQGLAVCSRRGRGHRRGAIVGAHPTAGHLHAAPHTGEPRPEGADRKRELPWVPPLPPPQPTEFALWRVRSRGRSREGWGCGVEWAGKGCTHAHWF